MTWRTDGRADGEADHRGRGDKAHLCVTGTPPPLNLARDCDVSSLVPERRGRERGREGGGEIDEKVAQTGGGCGDDK